MLYPNVFPAVVTDLPSDMINRLVETLRTHMEDIDMGAPICLCLAKLAEHPVNAANIVASPIIGYLAAMLKMHINIPRAAEAIVSLLRPLSVDLEVMSIHAHAQHITYVHTMW